MIPPKISIIIPTLNAASILENCLKSIKAQNYPQKQIEIIVADGGSADDTIKLAKKYHCQILSNLLKTGESGKAVGAKSATGKFILLLDSDNILPDPYWLKTMVKPLLCNPKLIGSEPIKFTYRRRAGFIERYSALIGANDPFAFVTGVYDRINYINHRWTNQKISTVNHLSYLQLKLTPNSILPTIGANGTIFRSSFLKTHLHSEYLFDIDIISQVLHQTQKPLYFAKVKTGIIHTFCESSIKKFIRKQNRRLVDYFSYQKLRSFKWSKSNRIGVPKFIFYTTLIVPALFDSFRGFVNKPDPAWFFHPIACFITLYCYTLVSIKHHFKILKPVNRRLWQQ